MRLIPPPLRVAQGYWLTYADETHSSLRIFYSRVSLDLPCIYLKAFRKRIPQRENGTQTMSLAFHQLKKLDRLKLLQVFRMQFKIWE